METDAAVKSLKGVGDKTAVLLNKLGIYTVGDLIEYYPRSYDVFSLPTDIKEAGEGSLCAVECLVGSRPEMIRTRRYLIVSLRVSDPTGSLKLVWYNTPYVAKQLYTGSRYIFRGRIMRKGNELVMSQPAIYTRTAYLALLKELQPVYPLTKGITCNTISKLVREAFASFDLGSDSMPASKRQELGLISRREALHNIHFPVSKEQCIAAHKRLSFDEFAAFCANIRLMRESSEAEPNRYRITDFTVMERIISSLPYELTKAQMNVLEEIKQDMSSDRLMSRMIQGDVGSGKTIVAICAIAACVTAGYQACIMAPTDVLARQHYESFASILEPLGMRITLLTGQMSAASKKAALAQIHSHETDVIIGTHALIQDRVEYDRLALAVIDEQHRFGVRQREALQQKGDHPHFLAMSATPIPRSLAIILYGDLDLSIISEMPKNRLPIKNCVVGTGYRPTAFKFIYNQIKSGRQAYIICPMIDESEESDAENVIDYTEELKVFMDRLAAADGSTPDSAGRAADVVASDSSARRIHVEYLHGRMKAAEKNEIMERFAAGETDILVSTTVIEVGVNVPNSTVMMVENAERFGLAQLHQLRGRVGRGEHQSYCIFVKGIDNAETEERLNLLVTYNDGMQVAEQDLRLRGPGDFFGVRQSGEMCFRLADIYGDADMLKAAGDYINGLDREALLCLRRTQTNNWII